MTGPWLPVLLAAAAGYLLGSLPFAILVSRLLGRPDIRTQGSGNAGMTNMLRSYGKAAAALTAVGDGAKGALAVLAARGLCAAFGADPGFDAGWIGALAAVAGHVWPAWFGFRGGKGVMAAFGAVLVLDPAVFLVLLVLAVPAFLLTRTMSVVSLGAAAELPLATLGIALLRHAPWLAATLFAAACAGIVAFAHRENVKRLAAGTEKPILPRRRKGPPEA